MAFIGRGITGRGNRQPNYQKWAALPGQTQFTLTRSVFRPESVQVVVNDAVKEPYVDYTVINGNILNFLVGLTGGDDVYIVDRDEGSLRINDETRATKVAPTTSGTLTHDGNIVVSGTGRRITGDFSNATLANRLMFQSNTVNGNTSINVLPNGTATQTDVELFNAADTTNTSIMRVRVGPTQAQIRADQVGAGTYLPMTFYTGGVERVSITPNGDTKAFYTNATAISTTSSFNYTVGTHGQVALITLTNAITVTFGAPTNITEGAMYKFILKAGDTSARSFIWNTAFKFPGGTSVLASGTTTANAYDTITFIGGAGNTMIYDGHSKDIR